MLVLDGLRNREMPVLLAHGHGNGVFVFKSGRDRCFGDGVEEGVCPGCGVWGVGCRVSDPLTTTGTAKRSAGRSNWTSTWSRVGGA